MVLSGGWPSGFAPGLDLFHPWRSWANLGAQMQLGLLFNLIFIQALGKAVSLEIQAPFKSELSGHRMNAAGDFSFSLQLSPRFWNSPRWPLCLLMILWNTQVLCDCF